MSNELKDNLSDKKTWIRLLKVLLFAAIFSLTVTVAGAVVVLQFVIKLATGDSNVRLRAFGQSLGGYCYQMVAFMSFHSDLMPYPFAAWPAGAPRDLFAELPPPAAVLEEEVPNGDSPKPRQPRKGRGNKETGNGEA